MPLPVAASVLAFLPGPVLPLLFVVLVIAVIVLLIKSLFKVAGIVAAVLLVTFALWLLLQFV